MPVVEQLVSIVDWITMNTLSTEQRNMFQWFHVISEIPPINSGKTYILTIIFQIKYNTNLFYKASTAIKNDNAGYRKGFVLANWLSKKIVQFTNTVEGCKSQAWQIGPGWSGPNFSWDGPGVQAQNFCGPGRFLPIFRDDFADNPPFFWKNNA